MTSGPSIPSDDDDPFERSLESGLSRQPLSTEAYSRIHAAVEAEWRVAIASRPRFTFRRWGPIAAAIAATVVAAVIWLRPAAGTAVLGTVARFEGEGLETRSAFFVHQPLAVGTLLRSDETIVARGSALVELSGGGTLRIARGTEFKVLTANQMALRDGELYVDMPPELLREPAFVVSTPVGLIEHLGTQFDVATVGQEVRVRVREGRVRVRRAADVETAAAGTELVVPPRGASIQHAISTHGRQWSWIEALAPEHEIEDQKLTDFLQWAARETGRQVSFVDARAHDVADETHLHGSIRGLTPTEALEVVLATTSLRFDFHEDAIRVSSGG